ncbi:unnamed protein product [Caenorhabditis nigoni]
MVEQFNRLKINKNVQMVRKFYDGKTKPIRIAGNAKEYLEPITIKNCMQFKKINDAVCNYTFNEKLYFIASRSQEFARLAYYNDVAGSNERAIKFYEKYGFVKNENIIKNFYHNEPKDALLYIKKFRE